MYEVSEEICEYISHEEVYEMVSGSIMADIDLAEQVVFMCLSDTSPMGYPIFSHDNILDGLTFDMLILEVHCNLPKDKINFSAIKKQLQEDIDMRIEDAFSMLELCKDNLVKACKGEIDE